MNAKKKRRKEESLDVMKVVKGSDHRQFIAPCPGPFQSITRAEVKPTAGEPVSKAPHPITPK